MIFNTQITTFSIPTTTKFRAIVPSTLASRKMAKFAGVVCLVLICMVAVVPHAMAIITCGQVVSYLRPCLPYVTKGVQVPPAGCCSGINSLNNAAKTTADRRTTCGCLKSLASSVKSNAGLVAGLPGKCGVKVPYPISTSTDCSKYASLALFTTYKLVPITKINDAADNYSLRLNLTIFFSGNLMIVF